MFFDRQQPLHRQFLANVRHRLQSVVHSLHEILGDGQRLSRLAADISHLDPIARTKGVRNAGVFARSVRRKFVRQVRERRLRAVAWVVSPDAVVGLQMQQVLQSSVRVEVRYETVTIPMQVFRQLGIFRFEPLKRS